MKVGATYKTRSGQRRFRVVQNDGPGEYPVRAVEVNGTSLRGPLDFTAKGSFLSDSYHSSSDLIEEIPDATITG